ncbi:polyA polymerase family protein [Aphelenchoides avenae]|nr:polyA polymerase family protein [Aphelenchus avenae]
MENRPLVTKKIDSPAFRLLFTDELNFLAELFKRNGFEMRMAGGAVRDLLMGITPADVDFASTATPTEMQDLFTRENIRMLHKRGESHGTITCRINDKENFEITTLRIDVVCDGRRAEVNFTKDWQQDAFRRDLTINSLFLGLDGTVFDYTGGIEDIERRRVAFVGDAATRIQEDYLRILRYFRFYGRIAKTPDEHERETLDAIIRWKDGMKIRGHSECLLIVKIVEGRFAESIMRTMLAECGLNTQLGLPETVDLDEFERVSTSAKKDPIPLEACTALSTLLANEEDVERLHKRVKMSRNEQTLCEFIVAHREEAQSRKDDVKHFKRLVLTKTFDEGAALLETNKRHAIQLMKYVGAHDHVDELLKWTPEKFPVTGLDLKDAGVPRGPQYKLVLGHLFRLWLNSDLSLTIDELLKHVNDPMETPPEEPKKKKRKRSLSPPKKAEAKA